MRLGLASNAERAQRDYMVMGCLATYVHPVVIAMEVIPRSHALLEPTIPTMDPHPHHLVRPVQQESTVLLAVLRPLLVQMVNTVNRRV